jgi:alkylhydroperoxidase/carboxymuconolactone decarboxylase family protein YurZ
MKSSRGVEMPDETESPVLDLLGEMTADSVEASSLDPETLMLVRIAALVAVDAPPASYMMNLAAAKDLGIDDDQVRGVLAAIAPIVGTARVVSAMGKIVRALGLAIELAELEEVEG